MYMQIDIHGARMTSDKTEIPSRNYRKTYATYTIPTYVDDYLRTNFPKGKISRFVSKVLAEGIEKHKNSTKTILS